MTAFVAISCTDEASNIRSVSLYEEHTVYVAFHSRPDVDLSSFRMPTISCHRVRRPLKRYLFVLTALTVAVRLDCPAKER